MKRIAYVLAMVFLFAGSGAIANASDGTITTRAQMSAQIAPALSSLSIALGKVQASYASDQMTMNDIHGQLGSLAASLVQIDPTPATDAELVKSEEIVSNASASMTMLAQEASGINAREAAEATMLGGVSTALSGILTTYLSLPA